jgi:hypothetical protein
MNIGANVTGNVTAPYFIGNGSLLTGIASPYGNANVAAYLPTYTGNLSAGNLSVSSSGDTWTIEGQTITAPGGAIWYSNPDQNTDDFISAPGSNIRIQALNNSNVVEGQFSLTSASASLFVNNGISRTWNFNESGNTEFPGCLIPLGVGGVCGNIGNLTNPWSNAYISGNISAGNISLTGQVTSNLIPVGNNTQTLGNATNRWSNLYLSGNTIYLGNLSLSAGADGLTSTAGFDLGNSVATEITANVLSANAVNIGTGGIGIGDDNFLVIETLVPGGLRPSNDDMYLLGNVDYRWSEVHANVYYGDGSQLTGLSFTSISNDGSIVDIPVSNGDVTITANSTQTWAFDTTGNLVLPQGGTILESTYLGAGSIRLQPNGGSATQYLEIAPTAVDGDHVHLMAGSGNTELFLGDDNQYVKLANTGAVVINSNDSAGNTAQWDFGVDGTISTNNDLTIQVTNGVPGAVTAITGSSGFWESNPVNNLATIGGTGTGLTVNVTESGGYASAIAIATAGTGYTNSDTITVTSGTSNATFTISVPIADWEFDAAGSLTLPGGSRLRPLGANLDIFAGSGSYVNLITDDESSYMGVDGSGGYIVTAGGTWNFDNTGNLTAPGNISMDWLDVGNIGNIAVLAADVKLQITADAGNTAPYWTFNNDGTLYVPGNISGDNSAPLIVEGSGSGEGYISLPHATFGGEQVAIVNKFGLGNGIRLETNGGNIFFDDTGNLTVPGNIIMPPGTSLRGSGASPAPSISGFTSVSAETLSATGNVTGGNLLTGGQITSTGAGNTATNGGQIFLNGATLNRIDWNTNGTGAPEYTTRSAGAKVVLYPSIGGSSTDYALGVEAGALWSGIPGNDGGQFFKWYGGNVPVASLSGTGVFSVTGNVTGGNIITAGNVSGNTAGYAIGYRDIPQVSFTGNATIATTDAGKHYYSTQSSNYTLTIANNASQGFQVGAAITVVNQGTGTITIAQGSNVTLYLAGNATSGNRSVATFGMATIMKVATDTWFINGTGVS